MAGMYPDNQEVSLNGEKVLWPGVDASGKFTDGDFDNPLVPPSFIPAGTINLILDNLSELIKKLGGTPDNTSIDQLAKLMSMASQGDVSGANSTQGTGLVKTANRNPSEKECQQNEPWAASPNWVYNLLVGNAASEVNTAVTGALKERLGVNSLAGDTFRFRGDVTKANIDNVVIPGSYSVLSSGYSGALLVFATYGSTGIVQFYKDGYQDEAWMCRNAIDGDKLRWTDWRRFETFENIAIKLFSQYTFAITYENAQPPSISGYRWELASKGSSVYPVRPVGNVGPGAVYCYWSLKAV